MIDAARLARRLAEEYLAAEAPAALPELASSFDEVFRQAVAAAEVRGESDPESRGLPFDAASLDWSAAATVAWIASHLALVVALVVAQRRSERALRRALDRVEARLAAATGQARWAHELRIRLEVAGQEGSLVAPGATPAGAARAAEAEPASVPGRTDLDLLIGWEPQAGSGGRLAWTAHADDPALDLTHRSFGSVPLRRDPIAYFAELLPLLEELGEAATVYGAAAERQLRGIGAQLWEELVPAELAARLTELTRRVRTVRILSQEGWTPWEVLLVPGVASEHGDGVFLGELFAVARWTDRMSAAAPLLPLRHVALLAPPAPGLTGAGRERDLLLSFTGAAREVIEVEADPQVVLEAMTAGTYDAWHFAGHCEAEGGDPDRWRLWLGAQRSLAPSDLYTTGLGLARSRPFVFLNACASGRRTLSLTGLGGWAQRLLQRGAAAVVGTQWAVPDGSACEFAAAFYARLFAGVPIAEAARQARCALLATAPGDPTRLAYAVFAHPLARCGAERPEPPPR